MPASRRPRLSTFDSGDALAVAVEIADHLCQRAIVGGRQATWMGFQPQYDPSSGEIAPAFGTLGPDLYGGTSGIALFLAETSRHSADPTHRRTAERAMVHAAARLSTMPRERGLGMYTGGVGVAYAAIRVGTILEKPDLVRQARGFLGNLRGKRLGTPALDVISGAAGAIPTLLMLRGAVGQPDLDRLVRRLGNMLMAKAHKSRIGWSWGPDATGFRPVRNLTGFSHGAAGIGWALLELHHHFGEGKFLEGALHAFRYENHWFRPERDNWPDFRLFDGRSEEAPCFTAWCHGAPGIGLSRLRAWQIRGTEDHRRDAEAAVRAALATLAEVSDTEERDFTLCHGLGGICDFLWWAAGILGNEEARHMVHGIAAAAAQRYRGTPERWPVGVAGGVSPSLMIGQAGIGHFYLRLADPSVPSVLMIGSGTTPQAGPLLPTQKLRPRRSRSSAPRAS